jgi:aminopeptidase N
MSSNPTGGAKFRPQAIKLALFQDKLGELGDPAVVNVLLEQPVQSVKGDWGCPSFVYPNYGDDGYALVSLDPVSLEYAKKSLHAIRDTLLRTQVWGDVWQMVRDTEMPLSEYIRVVDANFAKEENEILLERIADTLSGRRSERASVINYWPQSTDGERKARIDFIAKVEAQYLKRLQASKPGSDEQKFWFDAYVSLAQTPEALSRLAGWAKSLKVAPGLAVDLDRRWALVRQLTRYEHKDAPALFTQLKKIDNSDRGQKGRLAIEAIQPNLTIKQKWVEIVKQPKPALSLADARSVLGSLFPIEQMALAKRFDKDFYEYLQANGASENDVFVQAVAGAISPLSCDEKDSARFKAFLSTATGFTPTVSKELKVDLQEDERCQRIRAFSAL